MTEGGPDDVPQHRTERTPRHRRADPDSAAASRQTHVGRLTEAQMKEYIRTLVDEAPPLTEEHRGRLARFFRNSLTSRSAT
jgi:hypothetical protein